MKRPLKKTSAIVMLAYDTHHDTMTGANFYLEKDKEAKTTALHFEISNNLRSRIRTNATDDVEEFVSDKHAQLKKVQILDEKVLKELESTLPHWVGDEDWKLAMVIEAGYKFSYGIENITSDTGSISIEVSSH